MAEDAGTITSEIRADISKLDGDVEKAVNAFRKIPAAVDKTNNETVNKFADMGKGVHQTLSKMSNNSISQLTKMMSGMKKAIMAVPIVGLIVGMTSAIRKAFTQLISYVNTSAQAYVQHQQELARLGQVLQNTGATAWTTTRLLRDAANELAGASGRSVNEILKMQTSLLSFRNITGETFDRTSQAIVDMAAVMGTDLSKATQRMGRALQDPVYGMRMLARYGFVFSDNQQELIRTLVASGNHLEAQAMLVERVEGAFMGAAAAIDTVNAAESRLSTAHEQLAIEQGERTNSFRNWWLGWQIALTEGRVEILDLENRFDRAMRFDTSTAKQNIRALNEQINASTTLLEQSGYMMQRLDIEFELASSNMIIAQRRLNDYLATGSRDTSSSPIAQYLENQIEINERLMNRVQSDIQRIANQSGRLINDQEVEKANMNDIAEMQINISDIADRRLRTLKEINRAEEFGLMSAESAHTARIAAYQAEANAINVIITDVERLRESLTNDKAIEAHQKMLAQLNGALTEATGNFNRLSEAVEEVTLISDEDFHEFIDEVETVLQRQTDILRTNYNQRLISYEDFQQGLIAANRGAINAINSFMETADAKGAIVWENHAEALRRAQALYTTIEETTESIKRKQNDQATARWMDEYRQRLAILKADEEDRLDLEVELALMRLRNNQLFINATPEIQKQMEQLTEEIIRQQNAIQDADQAWRDAAQTMSQYSSQVVGVLNSAMRMYADSVRRETDILRRELDKRHSLLRESLERDLQARLHYKGFVDAATEAQHKRELELAIQSGDQQRIFLAHSNMERFKIEEEFAQKKAALDKEMAQEKVRLDYRAAKAAHRAQIVSAIASTAQSILMAGVNKWPVPAIPMMALAGAKGGVQLAAVKANRPRLQAFDSGGIVAGHSFRGDKILARVNSGEMVLNAEQQRRLFELANNAADSAGNIGGGKPGTIHITLTLDGRAITKAVVDNVNNRQYLIDGGSIK